MYKAMGQKGVPELKLLDKISTVRRSFAALSFPRQGRTATAESRTCGVMSLTFGCLICWPENVANHWGGDI